MTAVCSDTNTAPALTLYGKMLTFSRLKLETNDLAIIDENLSELLQGNKTSQIPIVIDSELSQDLPQLVELLWSWGLQPIGVIKGCLDEAAQQLRLAIFPADGKRIERIRTSTPTKSRSEKPIPEQDRTPVTVSSSADTSDTNSTAAITSAAPETLQIVSDQINSLIYDQMLRSGQSVHHVGGDLILTNSVNNGAEVITDNSLHIYGRAHGRLVAGATGDKDARIFCQCFNPSLVSVAGTYCLHDDIPEEVIDKPVQVSFKEGEGLIFTIMNNA
ncbi:septum site-determining protein MinC [Psychrobacter sp. I-STPA6b]|uniref:septum site-determining protein MinC n=1 Tax=Psychrobacter sp. I-STPA6b TaxID=2585718 RepID=UPI001D0C89B6|nr:septum site-determining protein MinC [Psychrobacter sp. I-STPA6b]